MSGLLAPREGIADDDGSVDPALAAALAAYAAGTGDVAAVVEALRPARVLVPVVAVLGEEDAETSTLTGLTSDKNSQMALVMLTAPDGRRTLPVFSGTDALHRWNEQARPVPVQARVAALSGVEEECDLAVLDPAGPVSVLIRRPALWAVAKDEPWVPSYADPEVAAAIRDATGRVPGVTGVACEPGRTAELAIVLTLVPGLTREQVTELTARVGQALAALDVIAERVDSVHLRLR